MLAGFECAALHPPLSNLYTLVRLLLHLLLAKLKSRFFWSVFESKAACIPLNKPKLRKRFWPLPYNHTHCLAVKMFMTFLWLTKLSGQCLIKVSDTLYQGQFPQSRIDGTTPGLSPFPLCSPPGLRQKAFYPQISLLLCLRDIAPSFRLMLGKCFFACKGLQNIQKLNILSPLGSFTGQECRCMELHR